MLPAMAAKQKGPRMRDLADTINANPILTKFASMMQAADLATFLSSKGPFTVFAPTDSAFARLPPYTLEILLQPQNKERLQAIVLYHVVNGKAMTAMDLKPLKTVISALGAPGIPLPVKTSHSGTQFVVKGKITHADIRCQNGIINEIDAVLMPPEAEMPPLAAPVAQATQANANTNAVDNSNAAPAPANAATADTNSVPVAPVATPEASPH